MKLNKEIADRLAEFDDATVKLDEAISSPDSTTEQIVSARARRYAVAIRALHALRRAVET